MKSGIYTSDNLCCIACISVVWDLLLCVMLCWNVSDKKATTIPSDLFSVSAESHVTVANLSRNCLTTVPTQSVFHSSSETDSSLNIMYTNTLSAMWGTKCMWSAAEEGRDNFVFVCYRSRQNYTVYCYFLRCFCAVVSMRKKDVRWG